MSGVTVDITTLLVGCATLAAGTVAYAVRRERESARVAERVNWLVARYAADHEHAAPWEEPVTDGGFPVEAEPDGDISAPHHFYIGLGAAAFGFASVWPYYPVTGASMAGIGLIIAADDFLSHAFGIPTPFDLLWKKAIRPVMRWYGD